MGLLLLFFLLSIVFSFLCSMWEAVLLSIPPSHVELKYKEGTPVGNRLKAFKDNIDKPLAAILTLNTIAHTVGAIGVGAQATKYWDNPAYSYIPTYVVPVIMTLAILILSEIIPKTWGANYWKKLTNFTVNSLYWIIRFLYPLVWLSQVITRKLKKDKKKSVLSRAEFTVMTEIGEKEGAIEEGESKIIQNLLRFKTILAKDIMTPRTVVKAAPEIQTVRDFFEENKTLRFSRIPVYKDSKDHITGFFLKDDLLTQLIEGKDKALLLDIKRDILIVNEKLRLPDLFNRLMGNKEHIALVVDEFGGMAGIVTMEDVIETLLGMEIIDEFDSTENMQALARKNWEKRAKNLGLIPEETEKKEE